MRLLALDIATKTGWRTPTDSGTFSVKLKRNESKGMAMVKFRGYVKNLISNDDIDMIVYESPAYVPGRVDSHRSGSNFEGVLIELCEDLGVDCTSFTPNEIKAYAKSTYFALIGEKASGRMNKPKMLEYAKAVFDRGFIDDNHVDAYWLYELTMNELL